MIVKETQGGNTYMVYFVLYSCFAFVSVQEVTVCALAATPFFFLQLLNRHVACLPSTLFLAHNVLVSHHKTSVFNLEQFSAVYVQLLQIIIDPVRLDCQLGGNVDKASS